MLNSMLKIFVGPVMGGLNPHQPPVNTPLAVRTVLELMLSDERRLAILLKIGARVKPDLFVAVVLHTALQLFLSAGICSDV
jgi:hypothetical protein